jgi:hypothetical protein
MTCANQAKNGSEKPLAPVSDFVFSPYHVWISVLTRSYHVYVYASLHPRRMGVVCGVTPHKQPLFHPC